MATEWEEVYGHDGALIDRIAHTVPDPVPDPLDAVIAEIDALTAEPEPKAMADVVRRQRALGTATANALKLLRHRGAGS